SASHSRNVLAEDGTATSFALTDYALERWRAQGGAAADLPPGFVTASELPAGAHLEMQAPLQPFVDHSISKTINVAPDYPFADFKRIYDQAYDLGLKGCTTFRPNPVTGAVLEQQSGDTAPHCCTIEREAD